jgi:DNA-binding transcriptional LysR family regulator
MTVAPTTAFLMTGTIGVLLRRHHFRCILLDMPVHPVPSLSTDQVSAFVEVARQGSLRRAAEVLVITEQGLRNRLLALEARLGVELYRKRRGLRRATQLTEHGRQFLPHAAAFLDRARELGELFAGDGSDQRPREVHVVASQYLILYLLIDAVHKFHAAFPHVRVRLGTRTEQQIEQTLLDSPDVVMGVAAPYEPSSELAFANLFSMGWSVIAPLRHPLLKRAPGSLRLADLADVPLILFERGSTGRQHVVEAFHQQGVSPEVEMETTNTEIIVRMVEAGLGVSVVPLLPSGQVTRGRRVGIRSLGEQIRPIHSGILTRRGERLPAACQSFVDFVRSTVGADSHQSQGARPSPQRPA